MITVKEEKAARQILKKIPEKIFNQKTPHKKNLKTMDTFSIEKALWKKPIFAKKNGICE
jgi:hypothetical protein